MRVYGSMAVGLRAVQGEKEDSNGTPGKSDEALRSWRGLLEGADMVMVRPGCEIASAGE
jgi:delta-aminolevulinic acid dehydratase/porphobilinogen synthase